MFYYFHLLLYISYLIFRFLFIDNPVNITLSFPPLMQNSAEAILSSFYGKFDVDTRIFDASYHLSYLPLVFCHHCIYAAVTRNIELHVTLFYIKSLSVKIRLEYCPYLTNFLIFFKIQVWSKFFHYPFTYSSIFFLKVFYHNQV